MSIQESLQKNKEIRTEVLSSVRGLSDEQLNAHPEEGRWSIIQVFDHLYLMERAVTKGIISQLDNEDSQPAEPKPIELTPDRSRKVEAPPHVIPTENEMTLEEIKARLQESRKDFIQLVNNTEEAVLSKKSSLHPVFGPLSLTQWVPFIGLHEKRHLAQIEEVKSKL